MSTTDNQVKHLQSVMKHINIVRVACRLINDRLDSDVFGRISQDEIDNHDASKFSKTEIDGYVKQFYTDDKDSPEWRAALMHHYHNNRHHWQFWLADFTEPYTEQSKIPLVMPNEHVLIMVADWLAAGLQYKGTADISDWLNDNLDGRKIVLNDETAGLVYDILYEVGFVMGHDGGWFADDDSFISHLKMATVNC